MHFHTKIQTDSSFSVAWITLLCQN